MQDLASSDERLWTWNTRSKERGGNKNGGNVAVEAEGSITMGSCVLETVSVGLSIERYEREITGQSRDIKRGKR